MLRRPPGSCSPSLVLEQLLAFGLPVRARAVRSVALLRDTCKIPRLPCDFACSMGLLLETNCRVCGNGKRKSWGAWGSWTEYWAVKVHTLVFSFTVDYSTSTEEKGWTYQNVLKSAFSTKHAGNLAVLEACPQATATRRSTLNGKSRNYIYMYYIYT